MTARKHSNGEQPLRGATPLSIMKKRRAASARFFEALPMRQSLFLRRLAGCWLAALVAFGCGSPAASLAAGMIYIGHAPETSVDERYDYHWAILRAALDATRASWGDYSLRFAPRMNEARQLQELSHPRGRLNVVIRETNRDYERRYHPVRIPIDRGLLGYRVLLIRDTRQTDFNTVASLADLRRFSIIQGDGWGDNAILKQAGLTVVTDPNYDGLFRMLERGLGDAFSRGVAEVEEEIRVYQPQYRHMALERSLLLYYPLPTYFWFGRDAEGQRLAQRVDQGMKQMLRNGEFQRLFQKYHAGLIQRLDLKHRRLIRIDNPFLPPSTPFADRSLWFDPTTAK
ncbi:ABC transporter substrate-binding protein [Chromobacterium haemolyticum]|uniref:ABC transporter substrate-binding protein n=1 Tax=Chromobacterium haemolyticum TaxID=394935 RepID=A0ABS3GQG9_9NEIS|nr:ABC transporter substrate-binding protein [Chromobacterium haemolyticum]MBK0415782.1 ABC transporter substrate-binding protein [Chromobacterium haemolyticum]MBO0417269.1 ABC transporter substrate-binding protein [Chromobacterium haemolyticum]MBO0500349.1 ABC transporter substrate-binding protein [Chromobacterium haemolyticum]